MSKEWTKWVEDDSLLDLVGMHDHTIIAYRYEPNNDFLVTTLADLVYKYQFNDFSPYEYRVLIQGEDLELFMGNPEQFPIKATE